MRGHAIRWEFDRDTVRAEVVCHEPEDADCHLRSADPDCDCEHWAGIERRDDGTIWHELTDGYRDLTLPRDVAQWHRVVPGDDECNVAAWMNAADDLLPESATTDTGTFVIAETPIEPVWDGDNYLWRVRMCSARIEWRYLDEADA